MTEPLAVRYCTPDTCRDPRCANYRPDSAEPPMPYYADDPIRMGQCGDIDAEIGIPCALLLGHDGPHSTAPMRGISAARWAELVPDRPAYPEWARRPHPFRPDMSGDMSQFCATCANTREIGPHGHCEANVCEMTAAEHDYAADDPNGSRHCGHCDETEPCRGLAESAR